MVAAVAQDRHHVPLRLAPDIARRLDKAARRRGLSKQAFVEAALLRELSDDNERQQILKQRDAPPPRRERDDELRPSGLGIVEARRQRREESEPIATQAAAPVVVNVGATSSAPTSDIERLATFVVSGGDDLTRETRLQTAVSILHVSATTDEERKVLAARLDEAVAAKTKQPSGTDGGNSIVRTARVAFDKLTDLWKGI